MNLKLVRKKFSEDGVFGELISDSNDLVAFTLEHSYVSDSGDFFAKIPIGNFLCKRGPHRLSGMTQDFETFEIIGIPKHSGILFHSGNKNDDSSGCVLLGEKINGEFITNSRITFQKFMDLQNDVDDFMLSVENQIG